MRLLLDTHILLWAMSGSTRLPRAARRMIEQADAVYASAASLWEIAIKIGLRRLDVDIDELIAQIDEAGIAQLPITFHHARVLTDLALQHRDPFDRILITQAVCEPLHLITCDEALAAYSELVCVV